MKIKCAVCNKKLKLEVHIWSGLKYIAIPVNWCIVSTPKNSHIKRVFCSARCEAVYDEEKVQGDGMMDKIMKAVIDITSQLRDFSEEEKRTVLNCIAALLDIEAYEFDKHHRTIEQLWECYGYVRDRLDVIENKIGLED